MTRTSIIALAGVLSLTPALAVADPVGVVRESGRTAGHATRDGVLTLHRTIGAFFAHGPRTAKYTWKANAARTSADARANKARVVREAHDER